MPDLPQVSDSTRPLPKGQPRISSHASQTETFQTLSHVPEFIRRKLVNVFCVEVAVASAAHLAAFFAIHASTSVRRQSRACPGRSIAQTGAGNSPALIHRASVDSAIGTRLRSCWILTNS